MNKLEKSVVFLTGADGGIGRAFIKILLSKNVKKIYITGLKIKPLIELASQCPDKLIPLELDVTNISDIEKCVKKCNDVNFLINNAGIELKSSFNTLKSANCAKLEMDINYIGVVQLTNSFRNILKNQENSIVLNILSIGSLIFIDKLATYCTSKSATHMFTQAIREDFRKDNITVIGVYPGYVDTSMSSDVVNSYKISTDELVENIFNDINDGKLNIFPDKMSKEYSKSDKLILDYI